MAKNDFNYDLEEQDFARRQRIADAMLGGALQPMEQKAQGVKSHWTEALAKIAQAYLGNKMASDVKSGRERMSDRYKTEYTEGMQNYFDTANPRMVEQAMTGPMPQGADGFENIEARPSYMEMQKGDPKAAIAALMSSNHPGLRQAGEKFMAEQSKNQLTAKDMLSLQGYDPRSKVAAAMSGNWDDLQAESKPLVVEGQIFERGDTGFRPVADARGQYETPQVVYSGPNGQVVVGQREKGTGKVTSLSSGGVTVNTGQKTGQKAEDAMAEDRVKKLSESYDLAKSTARGLQTIDVAEQALESGIRSGSLAEVQLGLAKAAKALGFEVDNPAIVNTEDFKRAMAERVLQSAVGLKGATSDKDLLFLKEGVAGNVALDEASLLRALRASKALSYTTLQQHSKLVKDNEDIQREQTGAVSPQLRAYQVPFELQLNADQYDYNPTTQEFRVKAGPKATTKLPKAPAAAPKVMTVEEYLKQYGGG